MITLRRTSIFGELKVVTTISPLSTIALIGLLSDVIRSSPPIRPYTFIMSPVFFPKYFLSNPDENVVINLMRGS